MILTMDTAALSICGAAALWILGLSAPWARAAAQDPTKDPLPIPKLHFSVESIDFGEKMECEFLRGEFPFRNASGAPVYIVEARAERREMAVGVYLDTQPDVSTNLLRVPPGKSGMIKSSVETFGNFGRYRLPIDVILTSRRPTGEEYADYFERKKTTTLEFHVQQLFVEFTIRRNYEWKEFPHTPWPEVLRSADGYVQTYELARGDGAPFKIVGIEGKLDPLVVQAEPKSLGEREWRITVTLPRNVYYGRLSRRIRFQVEPGLSLASYKPEITVASRVVGRIEWTPVSGIHFGVVDEGTRAKRQITFRANDGGASVHGVRVLGFEWHRDAPVESRPATSSAPAMATGTESRAAELCAAPGGTAASNEEPPVEWAVVEGALPDELVYEVSIRPNAKPQWIAGVLRVSTGIPDGPEFIRIPVLGKIREAVK